MKEEMFTDSYGTRCKLSDAIDCRECDGNGSYGEDIETCFYCMGAGIICPVEEPTDA